MANSTLTQGSPSYTFETASGTSYKIRATGHFAGADLLLQAANTATPTVYADLQPAKSGAIDLLWDGGGEDLKATLVGAVGAAASVNVEVTTLT